MAAKWLRAVLGFFRRRRTLALALSVTAALRVLALVLPLLCVRGSSNSPEPTLLSEGEAAALFADWWSGSGSCEARRTAEVAAEREEYAAARFSELVSRCLPPDESARISESGSDYVTLSDGSGENLRLCRKWQLMSGEWVRWIDVCFDMDTGFVYYIYINGQSITGDEDEVSAEDIAEALYTSDGWTALTAENRSHYSGREYVSGSLARNGSYITLSIDWDTEHPNANYFDLRCVCGGG
ncbi:MAG: hypothetical protein LUC20_00340 [Oscillospiraceae bacterium]|nr:hypothetical protein [Oscillospiraceae bacterium]